MSNTKNYDGTPWQHENGGFLSDRNHTSPVASPNVVKVLGADRQASATSDAHGATGDGAVSLGMAQLKGTAGNDMVSGTGTVDVLAARATGHAGYTRAADGSFTGAGAQGSAQAYGEHMNVAGEIGDSRTTGSVQGALDGSVGFANARGQVLLGDDGRYQGVALGGTAEAAVLDGTVSGGASLPIDWLPLVPKGWTVNVKGYAEGTVLGAGGSAGGYIMRDRADNRVHIGGFAGVALGLGGFIGTEISFGPAALTPQQAKEAAARAKAEAAAAAAAAAADLIRPMARMTDPIGAHSSNKGWLGMALGALVAVAAIAFFPVIIGVGVVGAGLMGAAMIGLGAVSLVTGAAAVGAKLGKLVKTEDGSPCSEIAAGSAKTICEGQPVARIDDLNSHGKGKLKTGAKMVLDGNHNVSRVKESSTCGAAKVLKGATKTFVGGPSVTSGAPDEATAGDALLDKVIGVLDTVSMVTGLAQLPLLAVSALKTGGSLALSRMASAAAESGTVRQALQVGGRELASQAVVNATAKAATVALGAGKELARQAVVPAAFAAGSHYGQPAVASGLQAMGMSQEAADATAQGLFLATPAAFAAHGLGAPKLGLKPGESLREVNMGKFREAGANATESVAALREGRIMDGIFGAPRAEGVPATGVPTDDVSGGARETSTTTRSETTTVSRPQPETTTVSRPQPETTTVTRSETTSVTRPEVTTEATTAAHPETTTETTNGTPPEATRTNAEPPARSEEVGAQGETSTAETPSWELYTMKRKGFGWTEEGGYSKGSQEYGTAMHEAVVDNVAKMKSGEISTAREAMDSLAAARREYAERSGDPDAASFGERRDLDPKYSEGRSMTPLAGKYKFAEESALANIGDTPVSVTLAGQPVELTSVEWMSGQNWWSHAPAESIPWMMQPVETLYAHAMNPATPLAQTVEAVGQIHWALGQTMPYARGSAGVTDALTKSIFMARGIEVAPWAKGVIPDILALNTRDVRAFGKNYASLFEAPPRMANDPALATKPAATSATTAGCSTCGGENGTSGTSKESAARNANELPTLPPPPPAQTKTAPSEGERPTVPPPPRTQTKASELPTLPPPPRGPTTVDVGDLRSSWRAPTNVTSTHGPGTGP